MGYVRKANGGALRYWRKRNKLTLKKLSVLSGVSYATISRIERDLVPEPRDDTMEKLADALELDVDVRWSYGKPPGDEERGVA